MELGGIMAGLGCRFGLCWSGFLVIAVVTYHPPLLFAQAQAGYNLTCESRGGRQNCPADTEQGEVTYSR
jgi:hypothetical protein